MTRDLLFGVRMVLKRPGFSVMVVLTLALGIGATAAVFSLIQGVLLTPPPYRDPAQLVLVSPTRTDGDLALRPQDWAAAQWLEWQDEAESFARSPRVPLLFDEKGSGRERRATLGGWIAVLCSVLPGHVQGTSWTPSSFQVPAIPVAETVQSSCPVYRQHNSVQSRSPRDSALVALPRLWRRAIDSAERSATAGAVP